MIYVRVRTQGEGKNLVTLSHKGTMSDTPQEMEYIKANIYTSLFFFSLKTLKNVCAVSKRQEKDLESFCFCNFRPVQSVN